MVDVYSSFQCNWLCFNFTDEMQALFRRQCCHYLIPYIYFEIHQAIKTEPSERNDSQAFSDWGESFTDEVTRMIDETEDEDQFTIIRKPTDVKPHEDRTTSEPREEGNATSAKEKFTSTVHEPRLVSKIGPDGDSFSHLDNSKGQTSHLQNDTTDSQLETTFDDVWHLVDKDNFSPLHTHTDACKLRNTSTELVESRDHILLSPHNILHETFDDIRHLLDDDSFSPPRNDVESVESGESKFMTPRNVSDLSGRVSQHWADDSDDSTWTTPPQEPVHQSDTRQSRETPPRSDITGTPKRGATSPPRGQKTPIKQQKLPSQVEKNVQITPVRNFFENLSTK